MEEVRYTHRAVYQANARHFDAGRDRSLVERPWLDRLLARVPPGGRVLDLGCGAGEPIAAYLIGRGSALTGVDFAPAMLALAHSRFPDAEWIEADMRALDLPGRFHGIVGWDSFFHLTRDEQRGLIPRLARHLQPGGALLLTVGPDDSEAIGRVGDGPVYHASLSPAEYHASLAEVGLAVEAFIPADPETAGRSVLFAVARAGRDAKAGRDA